MRSRNQPWETRTQLTIGTSARLEGRPQGLSSLEEPLPHCFDKCHPHTPDLSALPVSMCTAGYMPELLSDRWGTLMLNCGRIAWHTWVVQGLKLTASHLQGFGCSDISGLHFSYHIRVWLCASFFFFSLSALSEVSLCFGLSSSGFFHLVQDPLGSFTLLPMAGVGLSILFSGFGHT